MHSSLIGKIEKARRYAEERDRIKFSDLKVTIKGDNSVHQVTLSDNHWTCDCHFYDNWATCSHVMALQRILGEMLPDEALFADEVRSLAV